jgi:hypothetical protein
LVFDANASLIACLASEQGCTAAQALEGIGLQLFLVAHECGHYILGHHGARDFEQELAADRYAWDTLRAIAQSLHSQDSKSNQYYDLMLAAAAEAPLWYLLQSEAWTLIIGNLAGTSLSSQEAKVYKKRINQIDSLADDLDGDHLVSEFMPEAFTDWAIQTTAVSFERIPQLLVIDGVRVNLEEMSKGKLRLPSNGTDWVATDAQGVACRSSFDDDQLVIKYSAWIEADLATIGNLVKAKKWCDVIASTANAQLQPRSLAVASYLNRALYYLHAGDFIDPTMTQNDKDRADAERYRRISVGIRSWGLP